MCWLGSTLTWPRIPSGARNRNNCGHKNYLWWKNKRNPQAIDVKHRSARRPRDAASNLPLITQGENKKAQTDPFFQILRSPPSTFDHRYCWTKFPRVADHSACIVGGLRGVPGLADDGEDTRFSLLLLLLFAVFCILRLSQEYCSWLNICVVIVWPLVLDRHY